MKHLQKAPKKPLFTDKKEADIFISLFDNESLKRIAKMIFVDGLTNEETADEMFYCKRQIERIRADILKTAVKRLIEKQIPKKVELYTNDGNFKWKNYPCPCCGEMLGLNVNKRYVSFCPKCGQALDWSDTE